MKGKLIFKGRIDDEGNWKLYDKGLRSKVSANFRGQSITITVSRTRRAKSREQQGYYFACILPHVLQALHEAGNEDIDPTSKEQQEAIHEFLKQRFIEAPLEVHDADGQLLSIGVPSTAKMSKREFWEYTEKITKWAAEDLNYKIPEPHQQSHFKF